MVNSFAFASAAIDPVFKKTIYTIRLNLTCFFLKTEQI